MRVAHLILSGSLLSAPALANGVPKEYQVEVKNPRSSDAAKSDLAVPDRKFVEKAASDDIAEIELGKLALDKSQDPQVKSYAKRSIADHQKSLDKLESVAKHHKFPLPTSATTEAQRDYQNLSKLDGKRFDEEYQKLADKRHGEEIQDYQNAKLENQELKSWADQTLPSLKEQGEQGK
jgi:putative membrane protein